MNELNRDTSAKNLGQIQEPRHTRRRFQPTGGSARPATRPQGRRAGGRAHGRAGERAGRAARRGLTSIADGFRTSLQPNQIKQVVVTAKVETNSIWKLGICRTRREGFVLRAAGEVKVTVTKFQAIS